LFYNKNPTSSLNQRIEELDKKSENKINYLETSIEATEQIIREQNQIYKSPNSSVPQKQRAERALKQLLPLLKKKREDLAKKTVAQSNLNIIAATHQNLVESAETFTVMKEMQRNLKKISNRYNPEDILRVKDDIQEAIDLSNNVSDLLTSPLQTTDVFTIGDDTFDAELDEILGDIQTTTTPLLPYEQTRPEYPSPREHIRIPSASSSSSPLSTSSGISLPV
jgi:hypothetical protein